MIYLTNEYFLCFCYTVFAFHLQALSHAVDSCYTELPAKAGIRGESKSPERHPIR